MPTDADELARQFPQKPPDPVPEWIEEANGQDEDVMEIPQSPVDFLVSARGTHRSPKVWQITQEVLIPLAEWAQMPRPEHDLWRSYDKERERERVIAEIERARAAKPMLNKLLVEVMEGTVKKEQFESRVKALRYRSDAAIITLCEELAKKENHILVPTGAQRLVPKKHLHVPPRRTEQEMIAEVSRLLRKLPLYTARVMVTTQHGLEEHTIRTLKPEEGLYGMALAERIARISGTEQGTKRERDTRLQTATGNRRRDTGAARQIQQSATRTTG